MGDRHEWPGVFIFGVPRSGTTLLRLMLDAHPQLAIPPETHFLKDVLLLDEMSGVSLEAFCSVILRTPRWRDYGLETTELERAVRACRPFSVCKGIREFYRLYASKFGKDKWGDKTPEHGLILDRISAIMPEAIFIHIVRDGRDVFLSTKSTWFGQDLGVIDHAKYWSNYVKRVDQLGHECENYLTVLYEDLVCNTEQELKEICQFSGLSYTECMLRYHERSGDRIDELKGYRMPSGRWISAGQRASIHRRVRSRPEAERTFRWKQEMDDDDARRYIEVAAGELSRLGYVLC